MQLHRIIQKECFKIFFLIFCSCVCLCVYISVKVWRESEEGAAVFGVGTQEVESSQTSDFWDSNSGPRQEK